MNSLSVERLGSTFDAWLSRVRDGIVSTPASDLALRLTLALVMLHGTTTLGMAAGARTLCLGMLIVPSLLRERLLWAALLVILAVGNMPRWYQIDNHQFLMVYWVAACTLCLRRSAALATNARLLIGIGFSFAVIWELISREFVDGSFFYFTSITDYRLQGFAAWVSGKSILEVQSLSDAITQLRHSGVANASSPLELNPQLLAVARAASLFGLVLEAFIAATHVLHAGIWRHAGLVLFIAGTYFVLPVTGFAFLLTVMGLAQCERDSGWLKVGYLALLTVVQFTLLPWQHILITG
jgi:hypothetical protein